MRLFIAMELPKPVRNSICLWADPLLEEYSDLKRTSPDNLHVTLRFLGDADPDRVVQVLEKLDLRRILPVDFTLDRTGTFGRPPVVLWISGSFSRGVYLAAEALGKIPDGRGQRETRRFRPHVTLARVRNGGSLPVMPVPVPITGRATKISLISSRLTREGPLYEVLHSCTASL